MKKIIKIILFIIFTILWSIFIYAIGGEWLYFLPLILADVIFFETINWNLSYWRLAKKNTLSKIAVSSVTFRAVLLLEMAL